MATLHLILFLAIAVLISAVIEQVVPKVSAPLIQVSLGVIISIFAMAPIDVTLDPELFLILFIAPLLFKDAKEADRKALWSEKKAIISLAVGLVLMITLIVGFTLNWIYASIPLAAAFALGAALGPTDAVAVSALSGTASLTKRQSALIKGEALLNDASGVVAFQFAIAAATTGAFSLVDASTTFILEFVGGIALGVVLAIISHRVVLRIRKLGLDNITFHVLFEMCLPFMVYLIAEITHVSGILAVVACGIVWSNYADRRMGPNQSRLNIVTNSLWNVLAFVLNGVVFVLLGMQLPRAMSQSWDDIYINNIALVLYVIAITVVLVGIRFLWVYLINKWGTRGKHKTPKDENISDVRSALIMTLAGPKGAITLSIAFTIPLMISETMAFPQRNLLIFIASGVILCTLLLANFALPLLAPKEETQDSELLKKKAAAKIDVLKLVTQRLVAEETPENRSATQSMLLSINARISRIRNDTDMAKPSNIKLRVAIIENEQRFLAECIEDNRTDLYATYRHLSRLKTTKDLLLHQKSGKLFYQGIKRRISISARIFWRVIANAIPGLKNTRYAEDERKVRILTERETVEFLEGLLETPGYPNDVVSELLAGHRQHLALLVRERPELNGITQSEAIRESIERRALDLEDEIALDMLDNGLIDRPCAKEIRDNVALMRIDLEEHV